MMPHPKLAFFFFPLFVGMRIPAHLNDCSPANKERCYDSSVPPAAHAILADFLASNSNDPKPNNLKEQIAASDARFAIASTTGDYSTLPNQDVAFHLQQLKITQAASKQLGQKPSEEIARQIALLEKEVERRKSNEAPPTKAPPKAQPASPPHSNSIQAGPYNPPTGGTPAGTATPAPTAVVSNGEEAPEAAPTDEQLAEARRKADEDYRREEEARRIQTEKKHLESALAENERQQEAINRQLQANKASQTKLQSQPMWGWSSFSFLFFEVRHQSDLEALVNEQKDLQRKVAILQDRANVLRRQMIALQ